VEVVKIRLARFGRKKRPFYRIVVTDSRRRRDSGFIEVVGHYNPLTNPKVIEMDLERVNYWLGVGAQMSERVSKLKKIYEERLAQQGENSSEPAEA
jgi:small subunit ribosomal protein S16